MLASRGLIAAFVLLLLVPVSIVVLLGVRLVNEEREGEAVSRQRTRLAFGKLIATLLEKRLAATERTLDRTTVPTADAVVMIVGPTGVQTRPAVALPYQPRVQNNDYTLLDTFMPVEQLELDGEARDVEAAYRQLTTHPSSAIRAGAFVRLARLLRAQDRNREALDVYDALAGERDATVDGVPAELTARRARLLVLETLEPEPTLRAEAAAFHQGLTAGRWRIDAPTFRQYATEAGRWLPGLPPITPVHATLSEVALWLSQSPPQGSQGRRLFPKQEGNVVVLWRTLGADTVALVAGPDFQRREWRDPLQEIATTAGLRYDLLAATDGRDEPQVTGRGESASTIVPSTDPIFPWHIAVSDDRVISDGDSRHRLMIIGMVILVGLVVVGGWVVARAVSRELFVARLQAEFVATVSHEFRTPLTSLRQFTELLLQTADLPDEKRRRFYAAQARATERLRRLVESVLDFRRMEAGAQVYTQQRVAVAPLLRTVIEAFRAEAATGEVDITLGEGTGEVAIEGDPQALSLVIWNLLDNAVKYSSDARGVRVLLTARAGSVLIAVEDQGFGIPRAEQREIFEKFMRGREARERGIKGTGLGLAIVKHIVQAHGGEVTVESAPGAGSTFTIVLPLAS